MNKNLRHKLKNIVFAHQQSGYNTDMTQKPKVTFLPVNIECSFSGQVTVLELATQNNLLINSSCGGNATCTTCRVFVESHLSQLPERTEQEKETLEGRGFADKERLSCQLQAFDGLVVRLL